MTSQLIIKTATESIPLDMEFQPTGLFSDELAVDLEREQDKDSIIDYTDGLPMPRTIYVDALKRFTTVAEREDYINQLRLIVGQAETLEYAGEIGFLVESAWVNFGFSPNRVLDVDIRIHFTFAKTDFSSYWLDGVFLFRSDILLSRTDITLETLRSA